MVTSSESCGFPHIVTPFPAVASPPKHPKYASSKGFCHTAINYEIDRRIDDNEQVIEMKKHESGNRYMKPESNIEK